MIVVTTHNGKPDKVTCHNSSPPSGLPFSSCFRMTARTKPSMFQLEIYSSSLYLPNTSNTDITGHHPSPVTLERLKACLSAHRIPN